MMADQCEACGAYKSDQKPLYDEMLRYQRIFWKLPKGIQELVIELREADAAEHEEKLFFYDPGNWDGIGGAESRAIFRTRCLGH